MTTMRMFRTTVAAVAVTALLAGSALGANDQLTEARRAEPGLALAAALINVVYLPLRLAVTAAGGVLGGVTGFLTAGNSKAAQDVFGLTDGTQVITPDILDGSKPFHFSRYD
jgi:hypothetical protein